MEWVADLRMVGHGTKWTKKNAVERLQVFQCHQTIHNISHCDVSKCWRQQHGEQNTTKNRQTINTIQAPMQFHVQSMLMCVGVMENQIRSMVWVWFLLWKKKLKHLRSLRQHWKRKTNKRIHWFHWNITTNFEPDVQRHTPCNLRNHIGACSRERYPPDKTYSRVFVDTRIPAAQKKTMRACNGAPNFHVWYVYLTFAIDKQNMKTYEDLLNRWFW